MDDVTRVNEMCSCKNNEQRGNARAQRRPTEIYAWSVLPLPAVPKCAYIHHIANVSVFPIVYDLFHEKNIMVNLLYIQIWICVYIHWHI